MPPASWQAELQQWLQILESRQQRLLAEARAAAADLLAIQDHVRRAWEAEGAPPPRNDSFQTAVADFRGRAASLLAEPLQQYERRRPILRHLEAIQEYEQAVAEPLERLPASAAGSIEDFLQAAGLPMAQKPPESLFGWRRLFREVTLRQVAADFLLAESARRAALEGPLQRSLADIALGLADPWHLFVRAGSHGGTLDADEQSVARQWLEGSRQKEQAVEALLRRYEAFLAGTPARLAAAFRRGWVYADFTRAERLDGRRKLVDFWARQQRGAAAVLSLESRIAETGLEALRVTGDEVESVFEEFDKRRNLLAGFRSWLEEWRPESGGEARAVNPPIEQIPSLAGDDRARRWAGRVKALASMLPEETELAGPARPRPPRIPGGRHFAKVHPRRLLLESVERRDLTLIAAALAPAAKRNVELARETERAVGVLEYGVENAAANGQDLLTEATTNVRTLLASLADVSPPDRRDVEPAALEAIGSVWTELQHRVEIARLGLLAHVRSARGRGRWPELRAILADRRRQLLQGSWQVAGRAWNRLLEWAGLRAPSQVAEHSVHQRADLGSVLDIGARDRRLPAIYRHLFRLSPVEDPRFLVGRSQELAGFAAALERWERAEPLPAGGDGEADQQRVRGGVRVAVALVGARGSGKTSLLNGATTAVLKGHPIVRLQLRERLTSVAAMGDFLRTSLDWSPNAARRIVILEEVERAFLRAPGGFEALRELLETVQATSRDILWVLVLNDQAWRILLTAVQIDRYFTHHVDAGSTTREDLATAILQRHALSGLRLQFAAPPAEHPWLERLRRLAGLQPDPQEQFFDALYRQSGGIYRAAFELWLACIERVEAGVVEMKQPLAPQYAPLRAELDQRDQFALLALAQHGSLTNEEAASVLAEPEAVSRQRLERLAGLGLIEADPASPGDRIRPEAGRFVLDTLHRVNLI